MSAVPTVKLNNGVDIPQLGFGVFQIKPEDTRAAIVAALEVGYRHVDTADGYGNEREVAEGIRESGIDRAEVFVTSKLNNGFHAHDDALTAFGRSLKVMKFDYLDLFLIHWPVPAVGDFVEAWGHSKKSIVRDSPERSAFRTSSRTTWNGWQRRQRSFLQLTRSRSTPTSPRTPCDRLIRSTGSPLRLGRRSHKGRRWAIPPSCG